MVRSKWLFAWKKGEGEEMREEGGGRKEEDGRLEQLTLGVEYLLWHSGHVWDTAECHLTTHTHTNTSHLRRPTHPFTSPPFPTYLHYPLEQREKRHHAPAPSRALPTNVRP